MSFFNDNGPILNFVPATPAQVAAIDAARKAQDDLIAANAVQVQVLRSWRVSNGWAPNAPVFPSTD